MTTISDRSYLERILAHVGDRDTMDTLADSAAQVEAAVRRLGPDRLRTAWGPGTWTGAQVLAHLADAEIALAFRSRQILTQSSHTMQEYDESAWMGLYGGEIDVDAALQTFLTARRWNLQLWRRLDPRQLGRVAIHPSRGNEALAVTLRALAGHTLSHLRQLEALG
jgi:DinB family protein